jgi:hypothetical protein
MQATQTYHKNIEYFTYTLYPEKLEVLVDFIINATKICLDKNVFSRRDPIIQKILRKCLKLKDQLVENLSLDPPRPAAKKIQKTKSIPKVILDFVQHFEFLTVFYSTGECLRSNSWSPLNVRGPTKTCQSISKKLPKSLL